jgi:uncharacterized protein YbcI
MTSKIIRLISNRIVKLNNEYHGEMNQMEVARHLAAKEVLVDLLVEITQLEPEELNERKETNKQV